jgi:hypothetical protein
MVLRKKVAIAAPDASASSQESGETPHSRRAEQAGCPPVGVHRTEVASLHPAAAAHPWASRIAPSLPGDCGGWLRSSWLGAGSQKLRGTSPLGQVDFMCPNCPHLCCHIHNMLSMVSKVGFCIATCTRPWNAITHQCVRTRKHQDNAVEMGSACSSAPRRGAGKAAATAGAAGSRRCRAGRLRWRTACPLPRAWRLPPA